MARKPVKTKAIIRPSGSVASNARRIVAAQTEAFFALECVIQDAEAATELHEMRIAAKRLRYAMELFAPVLGPDVDWCIDTIKEFQEIAGTIHDADVRAEMLRAYLRERATAEVEHLIALATEGHSDAEAAKTWARSAVSTKEWRTEQIALAAAINRAVAMRRERFTHLQARWEKWSAEALRARLEALGHADAVRSDGHETATLPLQPPPPEQVEAYSAS